MCMSMPTVQRRSVLAKRSPPPAAVWTTHWEARRQLDTTKAFGHLLLPAVLSIAQIRFFLKWIEQDGTAVTALSNYLDLPTIKEILSKPSVAYRGCIKLLLHEILLILQNLYSLLQNWEIWMKRVIHRDALSLLPEGESLEGLFPQRACVGYEATLTDVQHVMDYIKSLVLLLWGRHTELMDEHWVSDCCFDSSDVTPTPEKISCDSAWEISVQGLLNTLDPDSSTGIGMCFISKYIKCY